MPFADNQPYEEAPLLQKESSPKGVGANFPMLDGRRWRHPDRLSWNGQGGLHELRHEETDRSHDAWSREPRPSSRQGHELCTGVLEYSDGVGVDSRARADRNGASRPPAGDIPRGGAGLTAAPCRQTRCRQTPLQCQARKYYPLLVVFLLAELLVLCVLPVQAYLHWSKENWRLLFRVVPDFILLAVWLAGMIAVVVSYAYHLHRLIGSELAPDADVKAAFDALTHVVIVCSYKEPVDVLERTFASIAGQRGIKKLPIAVFAAEARDVTWRDAEEHLQKVCRGGVNTLISTEHVLVEGEVAGKSSNENWAAREVYRLLVDERGLDPFEVLLTIVDADSILSPTYLAHVEAAFREQPDGRRLVYNGPLNVYRNFAEAGVFVQCLELARCHQDIFHNPFHVPYPFSNYSLTLGFSAEIGFWTPDVMPEDIHTVNRAMVNSFGSKTTVIIPALICNDLVAGFGDRYSQAKRHQWGSVTELAWTLSLVRDMGLRLHAWGAVFLSEACRAGSFISTVACAAALFVEAMILVEMVQHWHSIPARVRFVAALCGSYVAWRWLWFWIAEFALWQTLLHQFPIERPSACRWFVLVMVMPVLSTVNVVVFLIIPTMHALCYAVFVGELAYVVAPKGRALSEVP